MKHASTAAREAEFQWIPPSQRRTRPTLVAVAPAPEVRKDDRVSALYREHKAAVYARCLRLLGSVPEAQDAAQEVFLRLLQHPETLAEREQLRPWLFSVATHYCLNLRRAKRRRPSCALDDGGVERRDRSADPVHGVLAEWILRRFDPTTRAIALGVLAEGVELKALAEELRLSRRALVRRLERFLRTSRLLLAVPRKAYR